MSRFCGLAILFLAAAVAVPLIADNGNSQLSPDSNPNAASNSNADHKGRASFLITPQRETLAMSFAEQHHPELVPLLIFLEKELPNEYDKAIRELYRTSEKLATIRDRDDLRYGMELDLWKTHSRIQLLSAQIKMSSDELLSDQLRRLLNRQFDLRVALIEHERNKVAARIDKLDAQLKTINQTRDESIERQVQLLTKHSQSIPVKTKPRKEVREKTDN